MAIRRALHLLAGAMRELAAGDGLKVAQLLFDDNRVIIGEAPVDSSANPIVIGVNSTSTGSCGVSASDNAIVIGGLALSKNGVFSITIGYGAVGDGVYTTAVGPNAYAAGSGAFALGFSCSVNADAGMAVGLFNSVTGVGGIGMGNGSVAGGVAGLALGFFAQALGNYTIAFGGDGNGFNIATKDGSILFGNVPVSDFCGQVSFCQGGFDTPGDAQSSEVTMREETTTTTSTELGCPDGTIGSGVSNYLILQDNTTSIFELNVVARVSPSGPDYKAWKLLFCINRESGASTTALVGTVTKTIIGATVGAATWDVAVTADTTNGRPAIKVSGQSGTTIRWVATAKLTQVRN